MAALVLEVNGHTPRIDTTAYVADTATVAGDVRVGARSSIWFGTVVRSELAPITIGEETNLQDLTVVHADPAYPVTLGDRVTVGHRVVLHGCTVEDDALIGMGAVVMNGAVIGEGAVVAAGAVVTEGTSVPPRTIAMGIPAKVVERPVPEIPRPNVAGYVALADAYRDAVPPTGRA
ncbi:gamma carbonic anhydrase family protein [Egicoccus halophilus]|uniref:Gamma carbonic anhydrase family protein n=1 Tax=Egicoccus halophilus TaxID=1670830 RepID=A0A8J3EVA6_9ACTN|nr:gamma carbonic anhydrase family protein [Egicoccus halophilus]GGI09287.1 gamma carbonic anhydrase family protein [Egicoccus halophilus]